MRNHSLLQTCYECVTNVSQMFYECVMNALRMCYGCVTDVLRILLRMRHEYVSNVLRASVVRHVTVHGCF